MASSSAQAFDMNVDIGSSRGVSMNYVDKNAASPSIVDVPQDDAQAIGTTATACDYWAGRVAACFGANPQQAATVGLTAGVAAIYGPRLIAEAGRLAKSFIGSRQKESSNDVPAEGDEATEASGRSAAGEEIVSAQIQDASQEDEKIDASAHVLAGGVVAGAAACTVAAYNAAQKALAEVDDQITALGDQTEAALAHINEDGRDEEGEEGEEGEEDVQSNPDIPLEEAEAEDGADHAGGNDADEVATPGIDASWNKRQAIDKVFAVRTFFSLTGARSLKEGQWHAEVQLLLTQLMNGKVTMKEFKAKRKEETEIDTVKRKLADKDDVIRNLMQKLLEKEDELMEERMSLHAVRRNLNYVISKRPSCLRDSPSETETESSESSATSSAADYTEGVKMQDAFSQLVNERAKQDAEDADSEPE